MTINRSIAVIAIAFCMVFAACGSKQLSRSQAARLIKESYTQTPQIGDNVKFIQFPVMTNGTIYQPGYGDGVRMSDLQGYEEAGWITFAVRSCGVIACVANVSLTPKGVTQSKGWKEVLRNLWRVPISRRDFVEVTGITSQDPNTAVVEFTYRWVPTEDGKEWGAVPSAPEASTANFRLYDDGWRLIQ